MKKKSLREKCDYIQVTTATATETDARRIATALVEQRLAACVQIEGPLESTYRWQGQIEQSQEWRCCAKTRDTLFAAVSQAIRQLHPYECPEILATPILAGSATYLAWLNAELQ
ncbi:MAG: divalent-cation tolerance protein CutA [Pirellulales bacterium]